MAQSSKGGRLALGLGVAGALLALAAAGWWALQPEREQVEVSAGGAPPEALEKHCREAIGAPRVEEVAPGLFVAIGYDLANTIVLATPAGNVVIDAGMSPTRAAEVRRAMATRAPGPTAALIYTHSHIDHVGGAQVWLDEGTEIWATEAFSEHFIKQYGQFREVETRRAARQFGVGVPAEALPCSALGRSIDLEAATRTGARMPTRTFSGEARFEVGGVAIELKEAHGETHDQLMVWLPGLKALMPGDNYYQAFPNLYTIRGTAPRPVEAWIASLDAMRRLEPEALVPSHTVPLKGAEEIRGALTRYRDGIQWVRDHVVRGANAGLDADTIAASAGLPPWLAEDPALAPRYGQLDWSARAIYDNHLGWFDGRAERLYPLEPRQEASQMLEAMGGAEAVMGRAKEATAKDPKWAARLLGLLRDAGAVDTAPGGAWALAMAGALEATAAEVGNTNGRGYLLHMAREHRHGPISAPRPEQPDALLARIPIAHFMSIMATRLLPERSASVHEAVVFHFTDTDERFTMTIRRGVAEVVEGAPLPGTPTPVATVAVPTLTWRKLALGLMTPVEAATDGGLVIEGDQTGFYTFSQRFQKER